VFAAWLPVGKIASAPCWLPPLTMEWDTGGETPHSVLPVHISVVFSLQALQHLGFFNVYQGKSRNFLTA